MLDENHEGVRADRICDTSRICVLFLIVFLFMGTIFTTKENTSENFLDEQMIHIYQDTLFYYN